MNVTHCALAGTEKMERKDGEKRWAMLSLKQTHREKNREIGRRVCKTKEREMGERDTETRKTKRCVHEKSAGLVIGPAC